MNGSTDYIEHKAIVEKVNPLTQEVTVRIEDTDECGDCPASGFCNSNGEPSNKVTIVTPMASFLKEEDIVNVRGTEKMHRKAIMYATVFPCIVLVVMMVGIYLLTHSQLASALSGLGATLVFYVLLWCFRSKISREFTFTIVGKFERAGQGPLE